jgi:hypothetical protein
LRHLNRTFQRKCRRSGFFSEAVKLIRSDYNRSHASDPLTSKDLERIEQFAHYSQVERLVPLLSASNEVLSAETAEILGKIG